MPLRPCTLLHAASRRSEERRQQVIREILEQEGDMKAVGGALAAFGALIVAGAVGLIAVGRCDLSDAAGRLQFIDGAAAGLLVVALGLTLAKPNMPKRRKGGGSEGLP
jgi:hypothetical protein